MSSSEILIDWLDDPDLTEQTYRIRLSTDGVDFLTHDFYTVDGNQSSFAAN